MNTQTQKTGPEFSPQRLKPALEHIEQYWHKLERFAPHDDGTLIGLPRPYFVPSSGKVGGFVFEEIYYWDTFFIAQGFYGTPRQNLAKGLAENLMSMMQRFHVIPNSGRLYHTSHSHPPFLSTFILQVFEIERNKRWLEQSMSIAKDEYRTVWMGVAQPNWRQVFHGLSRYYDINVLDDLAEAESGWDMTTRFNRETLAYIPVDLNALLYKYECDFETAARILGETEEAGEWKKRYLSRAASIDNFLWDEEKGCYFDYNYMTKRRGPVYSLAAFFPMWAGLTTKDKAARLMKNLDKFEFDGGLSTTSGKDDFKMDMPTQWAYPNGWAPLQLIAIEAMEQYGYHEEADRIARKWLNANLVQYEEKGEFFEKYNVVDIHGEPRDGVYPSQIGFGWTNSIFIRLCNKYLRPDELPQLTVAEVMSPLQQLVRNPRQTLRHVGRKLGR